MSPQLIFLKVVISLKKVSLTFTKAPFKLYLAAYKIKPFFTAKFFIFCSFSNFTIRAEDLYIDDKSSFDETFQKLTGMKILEY